MFFHVWYKNERVCITVLNSPNPSSVYLGLCKHRKKVSYCFYKIFLNINSTNELKFCLLTSYFKKIFSIHALDNHRSYWPIKTCIWQRTNQWNFTLQKSKFVAKSPASKRAPCKWKRYQLWILLNLWEKCLKLGENRRNFQRMYNSVRKEL